VVGGGSIGGIIAHDKNPRCEVSGEILKIVQEEKQGYVYKEYGRERGCLIRTQKLTVKYKQKCLVTCAEGYVNKNDSLVDGRGGFFCG
jgi:hypothetical protein